jgi:mannosyltransferase OCH1-like enzyme
MISKIIWQTHDFLEKQIPEHFDKCMKSWQLLNPGWEHKYVNHKDRESFIKEKYYDFYDFYKSIPPIQQSDMWRLFVVYEFGGVYVDMDSICMQPLDYMLQNCNNDELITEPIDREGSINSAMFAAPKNCTILKENIDLVKSYYDHADPLHVNAFMFHRVFSKQALKYSHGIFTAGSHSSDYKKHFRNLEIDYYGETMLYSEYLENILNLNSKEYL